MLSEGYEEAARLKRILIEGIEKGILITTYKDYIKSVEKISANVIRVEFE